VGIDIGIPGIDHIDARNHGVRTDEAAESWVVPAQAQTHEPRVVRRRTQEARTGKSGAFAAQGHSICTERALECDPPAAVGDERNIPAQIRVQPASLATAQGEQAAAAEAQPVCRSALAQLQVLTDREELYLPSTNRDGMTIDVVIAVLEQDTGGELHVDKVIGPIEAKRSVGCRRKAPGSVVHITLSTRTLEQAAARLVTHGASRAQRHVAAVTVGERLRWSGRMMHTDQALQAIIVKRGEPLQIGE
jgi:hypothetical protein